MAYLCPVTMTLVDQQSGRHGDRTLPFWGGGVGGGGEATLDKINVVSCQPP